MNLEYIYNRNNLSYPLADDEIKILDDVWDFIEGFKLGFVTLFQYRNTLINNIKKKYNIDEFIKLESIAEKIFWNLKSKFKKEISSENEYEIYDWNDFNKIKENLENDNYYRSFINKLVNFDYENKKIYYKKMEGSPYIFKGNKMNEYLYVIFFDRILYEKVMHDGNIEEINLPNIYYQLDYCFPNLNLCKPFLYGKFNRIKRAQQMYYDKNSETNWYSLFNME